MDTDGEEDEKDPEPSAGESRRAASQGVKLATIAAMGEWCITGMQQSEYYNCKRLHEFICS